LFASTIPPGNSSSGPGDRDAVERINAVLNVARSSIFMLGAVHQSEKQDYGDRPDANYDPQ
jgi:hypothetical protein